MIRRLLTTVLACSLAGLAVAQETATSTPESNDYQDVLFLRGPRPLLLRIHVRLNGKPYQVAWADFLQATFDYYDRDGDGVLSVDEAGRTPKAQTLVQMVRGGSFQFLGQPGSLATFKEIAADPESGEVTFEEFAAYYRKAGFKPLQVVASQGTGGTANALTDALFKFLDTDKDGRISKEEAARAESSLRKLDTDDDELVSSQEFLPNPFGGNQFVQTQPGAMPVAPGAAFVAVDPNDPPANWTAPLLRVYDRDKNNKLNPQEAGFDRTEFDRLDANRDGELDADELKQLPIMRPDGEFIVRLGKLGENEAPADVFGARPAPIAQQVTKSGPGVTLTAGSAQVEFRRSEGQSPQFNQVAQTRQFYLQQFRNADTMKKGYLELKQVQSNPQLRFLVTSFPLVDRDGDGKMTEQELTGFFEFLAKAGTSYVSLAISDQGRGLFDLLDANRDGRLGIRELRTVWVRMTPWTKEDAPIARSEIPGQFAVVLSQGPASFAPSGRTFVVNQPFGAPNAAPPTPTRGPLWFRKMDRNRDGDVSLREWLGTMADFKMIDTDGDGLIGLEEAEKFDAGSRKKAEEKR